MGRVVYESTLDWLFYQCETKVKPVLPHKCVAGLAVTPLYRQILKSYTLFRAANFTRLSTVTLLYTGVSTLGNVRR